MNPLHTAKDISDYVLTTGEYFPTERGTGRTTAIALRTIARCIEKPYNWVEIEDHHDSPGAAQNLFCTIQRMIDSMRLEHFYVNPDCSRGYSISFGKP